jgi:CTP:molybdopterin cytidylyltransferase MocA
VSGKIDASKNPVAVLLAAGQGARMGFPKALLEAGAGRTFLGRIAATFEEVGARPLVVVGADAELVRSRHPQLWSVENTEWKHGQWSSVKKGLEAALEAEAKIIFVQPVDSPRVKVSTVHRLWPQLSKFPAAVPFYRNQPGHPVALTDEGARLLLAQTAAETFAQALGQLDGAGVEASDPAIVENFNSPDEYQKVFGRVPFGLS